MKMQLALFLSVYSDSELFNVKWTIFHLYLDESRLLFDEMMPKSLLYKSNTLKSFVCKTNTLKSFLCKTNTLKSFLCKANTLKSFVCKTNTLKSFLCKANTLKSFLCKTYTLSCIFIVIKLTELTIHREICCSTLTYPYSKPTSLCCMFNREATNTNFIDFGLTRILQAVKEKSKGKVHMDKSLD